jgi:FG-GAP repeat
VNVIYGSASGLTSAADDFWNQDVDGIANKVEKDDWFGYSVAAGDFDGDSFDDLLVGVTFESLSGGAYAGAANVIYGTATGLDDPGDQFWNQDTTGISNDAEPNDSFAFAVTAGDFDGDGFDDAAFGVPGEDLTGATDAGGVAVIYGKTGSGLNEAGDDFWHQNSSGIEDTAEKGDIFGIAVTAVDFGNGPEDDLAVGVQDENIGPIADAGAANVIYGSPTDLTSTNDQFWNQDSTSILDQAEASDFFGWGFGEPGTGGSAGPTLRRWGLRR